MKNLIHFQDQPAKQALYQNREVSGGSAPEITPISTEIALEGLKGEVLDSPWVFGDENSATPSAEGTNTAEASQWSRLTENGFDNEEAIENNPLYEPLTREEMEFLISRSQIKNRSADKIHSMDTPTKRIALIVLREFPNLRISSGSRDVVHNANVKGKFHSDHVYDAGLDFMPPSRSALNFIKERFAGQVFAFIHNVGSGAHIHVSHRPDGKKIYAGQTDPETGEAYERRQTLASYDPNLYPSAEINIANLETPGRNYLSTSYQSDRTEADPETPEK